MSKREKKQMKYNKAGLVIRMNLLLFILLCSLLFHSASPSSSSSSSSGWRMDSSGMRRVLHGPIHNCKTQVGQVKANKCHHNAKGHPNMDIPTINVEEFMRIANSEQGRWPRRRPWSHRYHEVPSGPNPISNSLPGAK